MSALENILHLLPSEGIFKLSPLATLTVSGPDAKTFLQGQLSCNLQEITASQSHLGAYCDIKGRVVGFFRLILNDQQYQLLMDPEILEIVNKTLKRYAVFSKVTLDLSPQFSERLGILGAESLKSAAFLSDKNSPENQDQIICDHETVLYKLIGNKPRWEFLSSSVSESYAENSSLWEAYNILCGLPTLKATTSAQFTAHRLGLIRLNAVSFNKGCYLGQEIVARTEYLGTHKGGLYWAALETSAPLKPNTEIQDDQKQLLGHIINSAPVNENLTLILAALKQEPQKNSSFSVDNAIIPFAAFFNQDFL